MKDIAAVINYFLSYIVAKKHVPKVTKNEHEANDNFLILFDCY
jgi:hypothetical protein